MGNAEVLDALEPGSGKPLWHFEAPTAYRDDFGFDEGPRSAPAVSGGRIITYSAEGRLTAVDLGTGRRLWSVEVMKQYAVEKGFFGAAGTPLVFENRGHGECGRQVRRRHRGLRGRDGAGVVEGNER